MTRTFVSVAQCENARALSAGECRTAFANALAEFAAKTPSYRNRRTCFRQFGPCMPWPIGTHSFSEFRPQWVGISIDASASEPAVLPVVAPGRVHLDFASQPVSRSSAAAAPRATAGQDIPVAPVAKFMTPDDEGEAGAAMPAPAPGSGFRIIDGVLTYPAPARFQPKGFKRP